jgi:ABC-type branched-subunit amino acid transport system ATPase component
MSPLLAVHGLHKSFGQLGVLSGLQLGVKQGDIIGLIGPNGSGKTTLLNLISGTEAVDRGNICVAGSDITSWPAWRRPQVGIGRCFQDSRLWTNLTVGEHLLTVAETRGSAQAAGRINALALLVGLDVAIHRQYPDEINLLDRRRLELVMAAFSASHLLLLDEISAGLNFDESCTLYDRVNALVLDRKVGAVLMVEHRLGLVEGYSTAIGMMNDGQVVLTGRGDHGDFQLAIQNMFPGSEKILQKEIPRW